MLCSLPFWVPCISLSICSGALACAVGSLHSPISVPSLLRLPSVRRTGGTCATPMLQGFWAGTGMRMVCLCILLNKAILGGPGRLWNLFGGPGQIHVRRMDTAEDAGVRQSGFNLGDQLRFMLTIIIVSFPVPEDRRWFAESHLPVLILALHHVHFLVTKDRAQLCEQVRGLANLLLSLERRPCSLQHVPTRGCCSPVPPIVSPETRKS